MINNEFKRNYELLERRQRILSTKKIKFKLRFLKYIFFNNKISLIEIQY